MSEERSLRAKHLVTAHVPATMEMSSDEDTYKYPVSVVTVTVIGVPKTVCDRCLGDTAQDSCFCTS